ncbi:transglycosylase domain-containing protein [Candidatus Saccharibacteria bacterium]|nr:transglycosylase domain-containing protein [Candidatus Saccharibacteria bacterium]MCB9817253.1 transglycosylase domain-containing protein [Candidatus Nomurabacteria bacterium]
MSKSSKKKSRLGLKTKSSSAKNKALDSANIVNRNIGDRMRARKDLRARRRADQKARMPKNPIKRFVYYLKPKNFAAYWFNRDGAIRALKVAGVSLAVMMVFLLATFAYFRKDLPRNITNLDTCSQGASSLYYDNTGQTLLWASSGDVECYPVKLENINTHLQKAVIAIEDKDFYNHGGFSTAGVTRAFFNNLRGESTQGGSTITQQFVKNSLLSQEQTYTRKVKELILAIELERSYTKDEILNAYLNEISFGSTYAGAEAAARGYFDKPAKDLTLDESATLAALIPAPSYYSPTGDNTGELVERRNYVLQLMVDQGYITQDEANTAKEQDTIAKVVPKKSKFNNIIAPYFVLEAQKRLEEQYGATNIRKSGFKVTTTVDLRLQGYAEEAVKNGMATIVRGGGDNAAMVAVDAQTGKVLAMVGGRDFEYPGFGQINYATTPRSPGSTFKPYDYAALMTKSQNWGPGSILYDLKTNFGGGYSPDDYDKKQPGALSMRQSLGGSRNIPAIKAMYMAGIPYVHDTAKKMGLTSGVTGCYTPGVEDCQEILSTAIGDGGQVRLDEHVNAFATFSRMGNYKPITYYTKVEDNKGKVIYEWTDPAGERALDEQVAYSINNILSDGAARYVGLDNRVRINGVTTAVKTGTTNNSDNGWLMGFNTKIAAGVWVGHHENKTLSGFMEHKTAPIWREFFAKANKDLAGAGDKWTQPAGMKRVCLSPTTGYAAKSGGKCDIFPSWYKPQYPDSTKSATIDSISNKLATECTPERAKQAITSGGIRAELPTSDPNYNNWMNPIKARYGGAGGGLIPTDKDDIHTCDPADKPTVSLSEVQKKPDGSYSVTATIKKGKYPLTSVSFSINGTVLEGGSYDISDSVSIPFVFRPSGSGTQTITANVVDSVLYDASDATSFTVSAAPSASDDTPSPVLP